jgi:hypothetical protein
MRYLLFFILAFSATGDDPEDGVDQDLKNILSWEKLISEASSQSPTKEMIAKISRRLSVSTSSDYWSTEEHANLVRAQVEICKKMVYAFPGHAKIQQEMIEEYQRQVAEGEVGRDMNYRETAWVFTTLSSMQTHEAVLVLGSFLHDLEGGGTSADGYPYTPWGNEHVKSNAGLAARALARIGLADPVVFGHGGIVEDPEYYFWYRPQEEVIVPWQEWWQEVVSGKRTFRFEGDSQVYDINGPVAADSHSSSRGRREPLPSIGGKGIVAPQNQEQKRSVIPYFLAALALLTAVAVFIKSRSNRRVSS